ncbi:HTH-type transcriptional repressor ComR [Pseudovibrio axinellae]|uniref:HTH-type transcriptional repressor ComR n=2 Tax=Pseudovibrio axinellae TaxID=989403 RepID=A0A165W243_9HYPH|nr:HTH-type transcriptional repressor ComR [Pseudovibrio axinellae]SER87118.1 transcriptional regulator, TetR family [Pseudovibrio axinellae]
MEFDPDEALDAAIHVFWTKGFEATSTKDLMEAMGLSKSSLYQTFGSKKELFMRSLVRYCAFAGGRERASLDGQKPGKSFIVAMLRALSNPDRFPDDPRGCLLVNSTVELGKRDEEVSAYVNNRLRLSLEMFEGAIRNAQESGEISPEKDHASLARMLVMSIHGLKAMSRLNVDQSDLRPAVEEVLKLLD